MSIPASFPLFNTLHDWFDLIINNISGIGDFIAKPLNELYSGFPGWLKLLLDKILGDVGNHSLIGFMLGTGLTVYIGWSVVKFFTGAFT